MNNVLVVVPAYNEEKNIARIIEEITVAAPSCDIIVVDDGSEDTTAKIVKDMGESLISHPINLGAGGAIQTGLKYALRNNYNIAIVVDGDGQHDPREIPKFIAVLKTTSVDVAIGSRFLVKGKRNIHWARLIGIFIFSKITSLIIGQKITDTTSGFRAFNRNAIQFLSREIPQDFPDAEIIILLSLAGFKLVEVPVGVRARTDGQSMYTVLRSIYYPFKLVIAILAILFRLFFKKLTYKKQG